MTCHGQGTLQVLESLMWAICIRKQKINCKTSLNLSWGPEIKKSIAKPAWIYLEVLKLKNLWTFAVLSFKTSFKGRSVKKVPPSLGIVWRDISQWAGHLSVGGTFLSLEIKKSIERPAWIYLEVLKLKNQLWKQAWIYPRRFTGSILSRGTKKIYGEWSWIREKKRNFFFCKM